MRRCTGGSGRCEFRWSVILQRGEPDGWSRVLAFQRAVRAPSRFLSIPVARRIRPSTPRGAETNLHTAALTRIPA